MRSLGVALGCLAGGCGLIALTETAMLWPGHPYVVILFPAAGAAYATVGLVAWWRRPSSRIGPIMVAGSLVWFIVGLSNSTVPVLSAAGIVVASAPLAIVVHLLHAFPSGRARSRGSRLTVLAAYAVVLPLQAPLYLFAPAASPAGMLALADLPQLASWGAWLQRGAGITVMAATSVLLARRLSRATRAQRRVLAPLYGYGIGAVLILPLAPDLIAPFAGWSPATTAVLQIAVLIGIPVAFAVGMMRGGFARMSEIQELGTWLGSAAGSQASLGHALALALGDETVRIAFRVSGRPGLVDEAGREVSPPEPGSGRGAVEIELDGRPIAVICYDSTLIEDPELVRSAGRVAAIAIDRLRLNADLLASQEMLQSSLTRLVEAEDRERRRIARDLHDGLQARLVLLALEAQRLAALPDAQPATTAAAAALRAGIDRAAGQLRELVHNVMPALLVERGLAAAAEELAGQMPLPVQIDLEVDGPLTAAVASTAYFMVAEGLANAVKHACATKLTVRLIRRDGLLTVQVGDDGTGGATVDDTGLGLGLRSIADRIGALGGRLEIDSEAGAGTWLHAEIPCG
jgi:signal transduction histidine kinase